MADSARDRPFSWRGNETRAPSSCGFMAHLAIIGSVANDLYALSGIGNPEHLSKHLGVMFLAWGHDSAHDTGGHRVYPEMDLAVGAPLVSMDGGEPGVGPTDLQARGIDHDAGPRADSPRAWISTKVALAKAGLIPASSAVAVATHIPQGFPKAA